MGFQMTRYEVSIHFYGRRLITRDGPCGGLLEWPEHKWTRITNRPIGLERAKKLADEQSQHATVQLWQTADKIYDNGKAPAVPAGWYSPEAQAV